MRFLCDEGVDRPIVEALRSAGHEVTYVAEQSPGIDDAAVLEMANASSSLLVTLDKDLGELLFRQRLVSRGVLLLRLEGLSEREKQQTVLVVIGSHGAEMKDSFTVVTPGNVRIRRPPSPME